MFYGWVYMSTAVLKFSFCLHFYLTAFKKIFLYPSLAQCPLAQGNINGSLTDGIKQPSENQIFHPSESFQFAKVIITCGRSSYFSKISEAGYLCLISLYSLSSPGSEVPNMFPSLPWLISHHHIGLLYWFSGESSPKLLFLCQSEACYQATRWPNSTEAP